MSAWQGESCDVWTSHSWVLVIWGLPSPKRCHTIVLESGLGPAPGTITHSPSSPSLAVLLFLKDFLAEQLLLAVSFPSQGDRDLPESSHLSLHVTEGLPPLVFPVVETKLSIGRVARVS